MSHKEYVITGNTHIGYTLTDITTPGMRVIETFPRKWQAEAFKAQLERSDKKRIK